jgi:integrase
MGRFAVATGAPTKPQLFASTKKRCAAQSLIGSGPTLTGGDCQRLVDEIAAERTAEHARKALTALRVALRVCQRYGELEQNPCAGVRVPVSGDCEKAATILTPEEATAIIAAAEGEDQRLKRSFAAPLIALAFGSGLRLGELLALQYGPKGLDLEAGIVHVTRALDRVRSADGSYPILAPKSRASRRQVPLASEDAARLRRHRLATGRPPTASSCSPAPTVSLFPPSRRTGRGNAPAALRSRSRRRKLASCHGCTTRAMRTQPAC